MISTTRSKPPSKAASTPRNVDKASTASISKLLPSNTITKFIIKPTSVKQIQGRSSSKSRAPGSITINGKPTVKSNLGGSGGTKNSKILNNGNMFIRTTAHQGIDLGTTINRSGGKTIQGSSLIPLKTNVPPTHQAQNGGKKTTNGANSKTKNNSPTYFPQGGNGNHGSGNISYNSPNGNGNMNMMSSCLGDPCQHGTCLSMSNRYLCFCDPGYEGRYCQIDTDECENDPCQYGQCIDKVKDFHCECNVFFQGKKFTKLKTWAIVFIALSALALCLTCCCCFWCVSTCTKKDAEKGKIGPVVEPLPEKPMPRPSPIGKPNAWLR